FVTLLLLSNVTPTTFFYTLSLHDALPIFPTAIHVSFFMRFRIALRLGCPVPMASPAIYRRPRSLPRQERERPASKTPAASNCMRSEEHTSELQSRENLVCRLLLEKKKKNR